MDSFGERIANGFRGLETGGLSEERLAFATGFDPATMSRASGAALFWYLRNIMFFDLELDQRPDVALISYDRFVLEPARFMTQLCDFAGLPFRRAIVHGVARRPSPTSVELNSIRGSLGLRRSSEPAQRRIRTPPRSRQPNRYEGTMMPEQRISFMIIGAQKAGTTSLFEYVRLHPAGVHASAEGDRILQLGLRLRRGNEWYSAFATGDAPPGAVCGEASVAYMSGTTDQRRCRGPATASLRDLSRDGCRREEVIPRRIRECAPDVKLICVLRDPVARCLSHYRMAALAGSERRTFEQAAEYLLQPDALEHARSTLTGTGYIVLGEYFRILSGYWRTFPAEQLMVMFASDVESRPGDVVARLFHFIGVSADFTPANLGTRYRQAAVERRVPGLDLYSWQKRLRETPARTLWHRLPPRMRLPIDQLYDRASLRVELWNARRGGLNDAMPSHIRDRLISHFRPDSEALQSALGVDVPWLADWT